MNQPRRSKLKLIREVYIKVKDTHDIYYFKEKVYSSKWDAFIDLKRIDKETYDAALLSDKRIEITALENARLNIRNEILKLRRTS